MKVKFTAIIVSVVLALLVAAPVSILAAGPQGTPPNGNVPGPSDFTPHIYADGVAWASEGGPNLPPPNGHNNQSFNILVAVSGLSERVIAVAQFAPGEVGYAGGRWILESAAWNVTPYNITSYTELLAAQSNGDVTIDTTPITYFQCPLLPVK